MVQIFGNQGQRVTVSTLCNGVVMQNRLEYVAKVEETYVSPSDFAGVFLTQCIPLWEAVLSKYAILMQFTVSASDPPGIPTYPDAFVSLNSLGDVDDDALPTFVSARIYKTVDTLNLDPINADPPIQVGMIRIGGLPESCQQNGILNSGALDDLNALGEALETLEVNDVEFQLFILRQARTSPPRAQAAAWVGETYTGSILGSQNTRKLRL